MESSLRHVIEYDVESYPTVSALAESLIANERLVKEAVLLLEAFAPGLIVENTTVSVRRIVQESPLKQMLVAAIVTAVQPKLIADVPKIVTDLTGHEIPEQYHTLLTVLVMVIAVYGISKAIELLFPARKKTELDESYRSLTYVAGNLIQLPSTTIDTAVRARYGDRKPSQIASMVRGFFAPTAGKPDSAIVGAGSVEIGPMALAEIPQLSMPETVEAEERTGTQFENNKRIIIHAMDRDRGRMGWAGHIPDLFEDRIPMKLDKSIKPETLFTKTDVIGDVLIVYNVDDAGNHTPKEFHLLRIKDTPRSKRRRAPR